MVIEGKGEIGALVDEDIDTEYAWLAELTLFLEESTLPYVSEVIVCNGVNNIGDLAFYCGIKLEKVTISNDVTSIGLGAFTGCSSLTNIEIPDSVTSIGDSAFLFCKSLTNITIPKSVTSIGERAFESCSSLINVTIDSEEIASSITESNSSGDLVNYATTIYINEEIEEANIGSYITTNYTKQATSDKTGYVKYTKNSLKLIMFYGIIIYVSDKNKPLKKQSRFNCKYERECKS